MKGIIIRMKRFAPQERFTSSADGAGKAPVWPLPLLGSLAECYFFSHETFRAGKALHVISRPAGSALRTPCVLLNL